MNYLRFWGLQSRIGYGNENAIQVEGIEQLVSTRTDTEKFADPKAVSSEISTMMETYPFVVAEITPSNARKNSGNAVEIRLAERDPGSTSLSALNALYAELEVSPSQLVSLISVLLRLNTLMVNACFTCLEISNTVIV